MADRISSNGFTDIEELSAEPVDLVEITGVVKWFDVAKGFGFIVPDDGRPDVLLHVTCLRRDGYQTAYEGARVVVEALNRPLSYTTRFMFAPSWYDMMLLLRLSSAAGR